jgi:hypothetical protein
MTQPTDAAGALPADWPPAVRAAFWTAVNAPTYDESAAATLAFAQLLTAPATPPSSGGTHGLSVQHADALWDAIATPGPSRETYVEQHKQVCHTVAEIIGELTPPAEPTTERAAVLAEAIRRVEDPVERARTSTGLGLGWEAARDGLRRMADEAQPEAEARPPRHTWRVETRDPLANEWAPGSHFLNRQHAVERYETANSRAPLWEDGTPVERRIVRETTTYTVEEPTAEAQPVQPQTGETAGGGV